MTNRPASEARWASTFEAAVIAGALLGGGFLRLARVRDSFLFGDEFHALRRVFESYDYLLRHFDAVGSGLALPLLERLAIDLGGFGHWSIRAPAWLPGLALIALAWPVGRRVVGRRGALIACPLLAAMPLLIFYSHFARAYAAETFLCLLLLERLQCAVDGRARLGRGWQFTLALLFGLLPWLHPTALGFSLPVATAAGFVLVREGRRQAALKLLIALLAGALLCLALYAPAWHSLTEFVRAKTTSQYYGEFGLLDVATLLAGGRSLAWLLLASTGVCAIAFWRERRERALPVLAGCAGPCVVITLMGPYGDAYAYARYVLPCCVPACLLLGQGAARALSRIPLTEVRARQLVAATAALLGTALWLTGPYGVRHVPDGPYANTYLSLLPLSAFDRAWPGTPAFYAELARAVKSRPGRVRVIEAPALTTRTRHLYRNYFLRHCADTLLGVLPGEFPAIPDGPYVSLGSDRWRERANADYLILHLSIETELMRYWRFVYAATPETADDRRGGGALHAATNAAGDATLSAYMERHAHFGGPLPHPSAQLLARLERELGKPAYRDDLLAVWALRAGGEAETAYSASKISR